MRVVAATLSFDNFDGVVENQHGREPGISLPEDPSLDPVGQGVLVLVLNKGGGWDVEDVIEFFKGKSAKKGLVQSKRMQWDGTLTP